jgi:hypothetical protein
MGFGRYWFAGQVLLILLGVWWCYDTGQRFGDDLAHLRKTRDRDARRAILVTWGVTVVVLVALVALTPGVVLRFVRLLPW